MPVTSTIGIIYPPPEVRSIVDKTATFVARNGPEFEEKIRQNEISNTKFNFLNPSDPYHAYYRHKVKEIAEGKINEPPQSKSAPNLASNTTGQTPGGLQANLQNLSISAKTQDTQTKIIEQIIVLKDPPPELEFIADAPSISPLDIDCIKLTAQYVARNGQPFLSAIRGKEQRNPMFDFLKPQHSHFAYFNKLVDQYTKILLPPKDLVERLRREAGNRFGVLKDIQYRVEWERAAQREKQKEDEIAEKERVAYAQIDWHDFVVVETVEYQPGEIGNFPPPTTPADVGARTLAQERFESGESLQFVEQRIIDDESRVDLSHIGQTLLNDQIRLAPPVESVDKNVDQVAMDEENSDEEEKQLKALKDNSKKLMPKDLPMPPNPDNVIIRPYDPKNKPASGTQNRNNTDAYFKSPLTGELIPASSMSEHMRISMLDPRWIEQRQKEKKEREDHDEVLASGVSIEKNLKRMAEYRSDMFGSGVEEAIIGRKLGQHEEDKKAEEAVEATWEAHTSSASNEKTVKRTLTGVTVEDQIKAIHQSQGLIDDDSASKIGPAIPKSVSGVIKPSLQPVPQQTIMLSNYKLLNVPPGTVKPMPPMQIPETVPTLNEEPSAKRQKTAEEQLVPESEFMALYGSKGPVKFMVQIPSVTEKPEWNLNGQTIPFSMELTETISSIKNKLMEYLSMPTAKQKLQLDTMFIKDTNTLAFYNFTSDSIVQLQLKERGGRKK